MHQSTLHLGVVAAVLVLGNPASPARAQTGGGPAGAPGLARPGMGPGQGPQRPFLVEDWDYWWFLHQESLLRVRERLHGPPDFVRMPAHLLPRVVTTLELMLRDEGADVRAAAAMALAKSGRESAVPLLAELRADPVVSVRQAALLGLGVIQDPSALGPLAEVLRDRQLERELRLTAAVGIGLLGSDEARSVLDAYLEAATFQALESDLQLGLAIAAGLLQDPQMVAPINALLHSTPSLRTTVRAALVLALGKSQDRSQRGRLLELLEDDDVLVRRSAAIAVGVLLEGTGDKDAAEQLGARLSGRGREKEPEAATSNFLTIALGRIGGPEAIQQLGRESQPTRGRVIGLLPVSLSEASHGPFVALGMGLTRSGHSAISRFLQERFRKGGTQFSRAGIAIAMGLHGETSAAGILRTTLQKKKDPFLRTHVATALGMLGDTKSTRVLEQLVRDEEDRELVPAAAVALTLLDARESAQAILLERLEDRRSTGIRRTLLYALGQIGDDAVVVPVLQILEDPRQTAATRAYAAAALGELLDPRPVRVLSRLTEHFNYVNHPELLSTLLVVL